MDLKYKLIEIKPRIFHLHFKKRYDCNMFFLRYQEFYENASPKFKGKSFTILDFMAWYAEHFGNGVFTYPKDWAGFNLPAPIILKVITQGIPDRNFYDEEMQKIYDICHGKYLDDKCYIIGTSGDKVKPNILNHEIAHGLFYTDKQYKKRMSKLVNKLKPEFRDSIFASFKRMGYSPKVYKDECQAYLATGTIAGVGQISSGEDEPFVKTFDTFMKKC